MLRRSWQFEIALGFASCGQRASMDWRAGPVPRGELGVQFEVNVSNSGAGTNVQVETQWFEAGSGTWNNVSGTSWVPHASSVYRLHVFRPFNASRWVGGADRDQRI